MTEFRQIKPLQNPKPTKRSQKELALEQLTEREISILERMAKGETNGEIATALFLAEGTIKNNVSVIIHKLQANTRTQAVLNALRSGLVDL